MDNNELMAQVLAAMQEQTEVLVKMIDERIEKRVSEAETRINIKIEHEISRKIEALFDGYKLTHEKQWELERQTDRLQSRLEELEDRVTMLESKSA